MVLFIIYKVPVTGTDGPSVLIKLNVQTGLKLWALLSWGFLYIGHLLTQMSQSQTEGRRVNQTTSKCYPTPGFLASMCQNRRASVMKVVSFFSSFWIILPPNGTEYDTQGKMLGSDQIPVPGLTFPYKVSPPVVVYFFKLIYFLIEG